MPALAAVVVLPVLIITSQAKFDGLYGQDPYAYFDYATGPLQEALLAGQPPPPFFWPPGFPLLVSVMSFVFGPRPIAGQLVSLLTGALTPFFTYLLAREVWIYPRGRVVGPLLAGLICAFTGQLWQSSAVVMADTTGLAFATFGAFAVIRYGNKQGAQSGWLVIAAGSFAFAILTRWAYALPAIPASLYALTILMKSSCRTALKQAAGALGIIGIILSPLVLSMISQWDLAGLDRSAFIGDLEIYRWELATVLQRTHFTTDGWLSYRFSNGLYYALAPAHKYYFTPLLAFFLLPGIRAALQSREIKTYLFLVGWPGLVYAFHAGTPWQNLRFTLAYLPPLAVLVATGFIGVRDRLPDRLRPAISIPLIAGLVFMAIGGWNLTTNLIQRNANDLDTANWVEDKLPPGSQLITQGLTLTISHNTPIETHEIFLLDQTSLQVLLAENQRTYLLLDLENIERQWAGKTPSRLYHTMVDQGALVKIGDYQGYILFEVESD